MSHYAPMIAALVTMLLTTILRFSKAGKQIQDVPNERSLHTEPIPRIGGVGMISGIMTAWALMFLSLAWWVVVPMIFLFGISLLDDMRGLPVRLRLFAHVTAAALLVTGSGMLMQYPLVALLLLPCAVWMTNLYNFMDGSDGLAGGMAFFGFTMYGLAALMHGDDTQAMLNFSVGASALGFLYFNFSPAKVFMGDAGSIPLGFLAAGMGLWGWQKGHWPLWFPVLVFSPFIVDASITLLRRTLRGEKISEAHREHYYQRLVRMGWSHRTAAVSWYVLMFAAGASAIWGMRNAETTPWMLFVVWALLYAVLMGIADYRWRSFLQGKNEQA